MPHLAHHPSPGLGDLLPGWHNVPGDPGMLPGTPGQAGQITRVPSMGELLPGSFVVPQNPLINTLKNGVMGSCNGDGMSGCGCGGGGARYINGQPIDVRSNWDGWLPWLVLGGVAFVLMRK
jgi:hypothetical protein